ncbi:hypothetical protein GGF31_007776 [Allomyces arbusculus]|nr:hypothetical protein GGF31_007776 [Allomyces arbusculus]
MRRVSRSNQQIPVRNIVVATDLPAPSHTLQQPTHDSDDVPLIPWPDLPADLAAAKTWTFDGIVFPSDPPSMRPANTGRWPPTKRAHFLTVPARLDPNLAANAASSKPVLWRRPHCAEAGPGSITLWLVELTGVRLITEINGHLMRGPYADLPTCWATLLERAQIRVMFEERSLVAQFILIQCDREADESQFLHYVQEHKLLALLCERECVWNLMRAREVRSLFDSVKQDPGMSGEELMRVFVQIEKHLAYMKARTAAVAQVDAARAVTRSTPRTATAASIGPRGSMAKRRRFVDDDILTAAKGAFRVVEGEWVGVRAGGGDERGTMS